MRFVMAQIKWWNIEQVGKNGLMEYQAPMFVCAGGDDTQLMQKN